MVRRRTQPKATKAQPGPQEPAIEEETYFLNPEAVSPHLYCCICQEVFKEPWRAPCGHSYCKRCIFDWLAKNSICPTDRKPVTAGQLHHDFLVQSIIDDYVVACPWRALGCHNVGPLHQLKEHKKVCQLNPNNMPKVLQEYSAGVISTAQQELQRKQVQRSLSLAATAAAGRHSLPSAAAAPPAARQSSSASASASMFDQLISEVVDGGEESNEADAVNGGASTSAAAADAVSLPPPASGSSAAASSSSGGAADAAGASAAADSSFDDDEAANLPGGQLPSLRMRLYMNSQAQGRSEFVNFLENLQSQPQLLQLPHSISRFCEPPESKRPRLDGQD